MRQRKEESLQIAVSNYLKLQYPKVVFTSESSGIRVPMGIAKKMKMQRSEDKQLDMMIFKTNKLYAGLFMELKKDEDEVYCKDGSLRKDKHIQAQYKTILKLREQGYCAGFYCGFENCKFTIDNYMKL